VVRLGGLPGLDALPPSARIDVNLLLRLREAAECRELRTWLRGVDSRSDDEIMASFGSIGDELASITQSPLGRVARFLIITAVSLVPGVAPLVAGTLSGGDTFLLDRVLGKPGPAVFLGRHYPSIFLPDELSDRPGDSEPAGA
jgi:hypothetical protein